MTDRPTLAELAAESNRIGGCPNCGCCDWRTARVANTYKNRVDGSVKRRRICRNCHLPIVSYETMSSDEVNNQ